GRRRPGAGGCLAALDDRVGQLVLLRLAPPLQVVVEGDAQLLDLRVVEDADREQEPALGEGRDLLGRQWISPDVTHSAPPCRREARRSPPLRCLPRRRTPTRSRGPPPRRSP